MHVCVVSKFTCLVDFTFMLYFGSSACEVCVMTRVSYVSACYGGYDVCMVAM